MPSHLRICASCLQSKIQQYNTMKNNFYLQALYTSKSMAKQSTNSTTHTNTLCLSPSTYLSLYIYIYPRQTKYDEQTSNMLQHADEIIKITDADKTDNSVYFSL